MKALQQNVTEPTLSVTFLLIPSLLIVLLECVTNWLESGRIPKDIIGIEWMLACLLDERPLHTSCQECSTRIDQYNPTLLTVQSQCSRDCHRTCINITRDCKVVNDRIALVKGQCSIGQWVYERSGKYLAVV